jgi:hypothetical protein
MFELIRTAGSIPPWRRSGQLRDHTTASEVDDLLGKLCVDPGFCLPPRAISQLQNSPPEDIDSFTDAVFIAEDLDPRSDPKLRAQVRAMVLDEFARAARTRTRT